MKKILLILCSHIFLYSQVNIKDLVDRIDLDGTSRKYQLKDESPYSGSVFFKYANGQKEFEGFLKDGIQDGHWVWYFKNSVKKQEGEFKNLQHNGLWTTWYESGQVEQEGEYFNGKKEGTWSFWHENGTISSADPYRNGQLHGKMILWFDNGQKEGEALFVYGRKNGYDKG
jgi:antitoxin component YwqK of YwqJK toxin-antitoxin module